MTRLGLIAGTALTLALSSSPAVAETVKLGAFLFSAELTTPGPFDASGEFIAEIDADHGDLCYTLAVKGVAKARGAYVYVGENGKDGQELVALDITGARNTMCLSAEADVLREIVANPAAHYVSVYSQQYPSGAARGQLMPR
jgi:hypothetical protein